MAGFGAVYSASPAVIAREIDLSSVVPGASSTIGGFAGEFSWGPVATAPEHLVQVSNERELITNFGNPTPSNTQSFHVASSFLKYSNALLVSRAVSDSALNASNGTPTLIRNADEFSSLGNPLGNWFARYPGTLGNSIDVEVCSGSAAFSTWTYANLFDAAPGSSESGAAEFGDDPALSANDEIHIVVIDRDGAFTGNKGAVLEQYQGLSLASDAKTSEGNTLYYKEVINTNSSFVYIAAQDIALDNAGLRLADAKAIAVALPATGGPRFGYAYTPIPDDIDPLVTTGYAQLEDALTYSLAGGVSGSVTEADVATALDFFEDSEIVDVSLLFAFPSTGAVDAKLYEVATKRKDLVAFISAPTSIAQLTSEAAKLTAVLAKFNSATYGSNSYIVFDSSPVYIYDKFQDRYIWIPACGHMAGLCANTTAVAEDWFSPAGFNRGQLLGVSKLAFNPNKTARDSLYKARINPLATFPGEGTVLFGDRTAQSKASAFDRINVRRLFNAMKKSISRAARFQLFEINDIFTRSMFKNMVEPYLRDVQGRRGITDFAVICDDTNNTPQVVDNNNFVCDIIVSPSRSINVLTLNFVAARTGVNFTELVNGRQA